MEAPILSTLLRAAVLVVTLPLAAQPLASKPVDVVREFYGGYLNAIAQDKDPLTQDAGRMKKYVAVSFLAEINRRMKSPDGLEADPFLHAQDFAADWKDHISVVPGATPSTVVVSLGGKESLNKLKMELRKEAGV